jgi:histidine phosphotransferase ChpT
MLRTPDIAALIGSRICHDLISPLGAIGNGVELLELSGLPQTPEMALIAESVAAAKARIQFFRVAYGGGMPGLMMPRADITATLTAVARGGRIGFIWAPEGDQPRAEVRSVFLALQCLETAMPIGGDIRVERDGKLWRLTAEAARLNADESLWLGMQSGKLRSGLSASQVQFLLLPEALRALGRALAFKIASDQIVVQF